MLAFGPFTLDAARRVVTKDGKPLRLTLRCIDLLIAFARNAGKTLSKQELLEAAWPDPQSSDATLAQHVFLLRKALEHDGTVWIRTVPNVGYRFAADVRTLEEDDDERARAVRTYLEGARRFRDIGTAGSLRSAIDLCTLAISLDAGSAKAHALRAGSWRLLAESMHAEPLPCLQSAAADCRAALALDPNDADARIEAAYSATLLERNPDRAARHLEAALALRPDHPGLPYARVWLALRSSRVEEALRVARSYGGPLFGAALYMSREFERAREIFDRFAPRDPSARLLRGACSLFLGDYAHARDDFHAVYYGQDEVEGGGTPSVRHYALGLYIYTLAKGGDGQSARRHVRMLESLARKRYVSPMALGVAYLGIGEFDRSLDCVEEAVQRFDAWSIFIAIDPLLDELRAEPRFCALARSAA